MSFYYGSSSTPEPEKEPGGCLEALLITRAAFGALALPMAILLGAVIGLVLLFYLFTIHWLLGLLGLAVIAGLVALYARWERKKYPGVPRL